MVAWVNDAVHRLATAASWSYGPTGECAAEPTALTALALAAHGAAHDAPIKWLLQQQTAEGSVGVTAAQATPGWPTSLAALAWIAAQSATQAAPCRTARELAVAWLLSRAGKRIVDDGQAAAPGKSHDKTLVGWPWIDGTHSWIEPTAFAILALRATGQGRHARTVEGQRLLVDRLLTTGGCNYGNTWVLGQELRPHVQPTGVCLLALAGTGANDPRIEKSLRYLETNIDHLTGTSSLCFGLLALAAHGRPLASADKLLSARHARTDGSPYKLALLVLAALGAKSPLIELPRQGTES